MTITPNELFARLDACSDSISLVTLTRWLKDLEIPDRVLEPYLCFDDAGYQRVLMKPGDGYEALILCWKSGQRSPIHDHRGSACGVRVLRGTATETTYRPNAHGHLHPAESRRLATGAVCASLDLDTHEISNEGPAPGNTPRLRTTTREGGGL